MSLTQRFGTSDPLGDAALKISRTLYASLVGRGVAILTLVEIANVLSIEQSLD
jgi:hypothetical protein